MSTYYFNGSDVAATDPNSVWTNDANAFDGSISTFASCSTAGDATTNYLMAEGTDAPTSNGVNLISSVRARLYGKAALYETLTANIYTNGLAELLGAPNTGNPAAWSSYVTLSVPSGGWTWSTLAHLETKIFKTGTASHEIYRVELEVAIEHAIPGNYGHYITVGDGMSRSEVAN